jgi:hypothetical protein
MAADDDPRFAWPPAWPSVRALLDEFAEIGPRFHGTPGARAGVGLLCSLLERGGLTPSRQEVRLPGWTPGGHHEVRLTAPVPRELPAWPLLWSGPTGPNGGRVRGRVVPRGPQGLWGDSMVWQRFAVEDADGAVRAVLHARDLGPAAPQPLPTGSDRTIAHFGIGHLDGLELAEWLADGRPVEAEVECSAGPAPDAVGENVIVDIPGQGDGMVLLTAHQDTFYNTCGSYDNTSGTLALLHLAWRWRRAAPRRSVRLVFTTAEEWHLGGARALAAAMSPEERDAVDFAFNIDGLGRGTLYELFAGPETLEAEYSAAVRAYTARHLPHRTVTSRFPPTKGTDDAALYFAGLPTCYVTVNDLHRLHQPEDVPDDASARTVAETVPMIAELVDALSRSPRPDPV